jgi:TonB-linked SusC/RagA family outer membrane protein
MYYLILNFPYPVISEHLDAKKKLFFGHINFILSFIMSYIIRKLLLMKKLLSGLCTLFCVANLLSSGGLYAQTPTVSGKVLTENSQPLQGVSITLKNKTAGTETGADGTFTIQATTDDVIIASYQGYETKELRAGTGNLLFSLRLADIKMDEVVVVGYGTQNRRNVTSSVSKLDKEVLASAPRANIGAALQGTVPGLQVVNKTGQPGSTPAIVLRGGTSINNPGAPLVVVDGVIRAFNDIPAQDIASIELLKDAASTAIYGARANNGVILITTKQGKEGTSQMSYKFTGGYNKRREGYNYLNAEDYIYYSRLGNLNSGISLTTANATRGLGIPSNRPDSLSFDIRQYNPAVNGNLLSMGWDTVSDPYGGTIIFKDHGGEVEDLIFRNTYTQDHYVNVTGGNDKGRYFASFDYYKEDGIIVGSGYKRYSGDFNGSYKVKPNIEVSSGVNLSSSSQIGVNGSEVNNLYRNLAIWPTFNPWIDSAKTQPNPGNGINDGNPLYWLGKSVRNNEVNRMTISGAVKWDIVPGLFFRGTGSGYFVEDINESFTRATQSYAQLFSNPPAFNTTRPASYESRRDFQQTFNGVLNYSKNLGTHNISAMIGAEYYKLKRTQVLVSGTNAPTDDIATVNASTIFAAGSNLTFKSEQRILSQFARINYDFDQKYLLTMVFRRDGISNLSNENRWGFFPGMSAGWNVHREDFFNNSGISKIVSTLKPRISYGVNGNIAGVGFYDVQGVYASQGNYNGRAGFLNTSLPLQDLTWEKSTTIDVGADIGLLHDRITVLFDYYDRKTSDLLTNLDLPSYAGFASTRTNLGTFQNKGYEIAVNASIIRSAGGFNLSVGANASYVKNKILKLPPNGNEKNRQSNSTFPAFQVADPATGNIVWVGGLQEGQPLGAIYGFRQESIFQTDAEIAKIAGNRFDNIAKIAGPNLPINSNNLAHITPGDVNWSDIDKNDTIDTRDMVYLGNVNPKWTGGFSTTLSYKGFTLYTRFEFALGHTIYNDLVARTLGEYQGTFNYIDWQKNAWSPTNPNSDIPKVYSADQRNAPQGKKNYTRSNNAGSVLNANNSRFYEKGDYLANREMTLSYDFAKSTLAKTKVLTQARVYVSVNNLFYITKFSGPTPEPPADSNNRITGVYAGTYPTPRSFVIGVQVTY